MTTKTLAKTLAKSKPRETSGARTANRYDFQKDWSILRILQIHDSLDNYLIIYEHFDDIIQVDSASDPKNVSFFQIKTKDNNTWTLNGLTKVDNNKRKSPISLLIDHINTFDTGIKSLHFISNASFNLEFENKSHCCTRTKFNIDCLAISTRIKISEHIKSQTGIEMDDIIENITCFEVTPLSISGHRMHTIGQITEYVHDNLQCYDKNPLPLYQAIFDTIKSKTDCEIEHSNFEELCMNKGISKSQIASVFEKFRTTPNWTKTWEGIHHRLNSELYPFKALKQIELAWREITVKCAAGGNLDLELLRIKISATLSYTANESTLRATLDKTYEELREHATHFTEYQAKAFILRVYHEDTEPTPTTEES